MNYDAEKFLKNIINCAGLPKLTEFSSEQLEEYDERAAILEYDGGLSREAAEKLALHEIARRYKMKEVIYDRS